MLRTIIVITAMLTSSLFGGQQHFSTAGFYSIEGSPRLVKNFNPGWRFHKGDVKGAEAIDFDDSKWEAANLPHGLEILGENGSGGRNYQGIAWYRKEFLASPAMTGGRIFLYFEAVMGEAQVWVNGKHVVEHFGGYLPFAADVTDVLNKDGKPNIVAVMADNADSILYPPGRAQSRLDFTYFGGIYRDSYLIETGPVHVTLRELSDTVAGGGIFAATLDVNGRDAKMEIRTEVTNQSKKSLKLTVKNILENADFKPLTSVEQSVMLSAGESKQLANKMDAKDVELWYPDAPYLHYVRTEVIYDGKVVDSLRTRVGIRLFEMKGPEGLFVNKKWIGKKIIGANRHQDYNYIGNALPNSGQWRDVKLLREGGCNVIRAGHYPQDPAFYDACDELGMLTTTANPGWHYFNFKDKIFEERLYDDTRKLVRRDRNVASMLMWETAINEYPAQPDYAMNTMHNIAHEEYPFPGMYTVADYHEAKKGGLDMYYHGNDKNVNSFNREYGDGGEVDNWYSQNARTRVKMEWGEQALLNQAMYQAATLNHRHKTPKVRLGGTLWCGIDHHRGYHPDPFHGGLLNGFRIPRYTYYLYKSQYAPDFTLPGIETGPMIYITHELTQISGRDIIIFSNCDEIKLTWQGKFIGTQKPSKEGRYSSLPHPPFVFKNAYDFKKIKSREKGNRAVKALLVAEGIVDGEVVVTETKAYAHRLSGLALSVDSVGMDLIADGSDIVPIRATAVDTEGNPKVLASEDVSFVIEGPADIVGAASMKTSFGVATALIRSHAKAGKIKVTAYANGLKSDTIEFNSISSALPLAYDTQYMAESKKPEYETNIVVASGQSAVPADVKKLQEELERVYLEMTGKDQDLMELRSRLGISK